jgi:cytosine/adenosine deaminase-related metal-dependent hydrolase
MIIRSRNVVTMDGPPIDNGAVFIAADRIVDVGRFSEISARHSAEKVIDLGEQTLLPGLINAHCHLDYTCLRGKIAAGRSFTDWIRAINGEKAKLTRQDCLASIREGFAEAKRFGTTTILNLTAFPGLIARIAPAIRTWWFPELIDVREPERTEEIVEFAVDSSRAAENWGFAPHALFTASANLYRRCEIIARNANALLTTHLAESGEEMSMFRDASGVLFEFMTEIGRDTSDCGRGTPLVRFLTDRGAVNSPIGARTDTDWIVAHLNELADSDFDLLTRSTSRFHVVHCPRSHKYFGHAPFQLERLHQLGFNICLGTDSLASNEDLSLFAEMREFQINYPALSPEKILSMSTVKAARAVGKPHLLGRIRPNCFADLIALPIGSSAENIFDEIVAFDGAVTFSMINGSKNTSEP